MPATELSAFEKVTKCLCSVRGFRDRARAKILDRTGGRVRLWDGVHFELAFLTGKEELEV